MKTRLRDDGIRENWCSRHNDKQGAWLPVEQFHKGDAPYCKQCRSSYFKENYDPQQARARNFKYYYKHDSMIYDRLFELQNGVCAICGDPPEEKPTGRNRTKRALLATDHNHETGKVRGLLCYNCNFALGWIKDNPGRIQQIIDYLKNDGISVKEVLP